MSAGAMRAATDIVNFIQAASDVGETTVEIHKLAEIVEREMHSKEVLEVLRSASIALSIPEGYMVSDTQKQIRALIAKLED